jgi:hypothetical protein
MFKFPSVLIASLAAVACHSQSVDGHKDIYINSDEDIIVHHIICGDLNKMNNLKQITVFTNSEQIEEGSYFFNSAFGEFSYTFKQLEAGSPIMERSMLRGVETDSSKAAKDMCAVKLDERLPKRVGKYLSTELLPANAPRWEEAMNRLAAEAGRPALSKGVYKK